MTWELPTPDREAGQADRPAPRTGAAKAKVIVIGPAEAGKSTLIARLCANAMNLEVDGRTVAMDHGVVRHGGCLLSLVGVPGQTRFSAVRQALVRGARAAIWVHPAECIPELEALELVSTGATGPIPYAVYVNHRHGCWTPGDAEPAGLGWPRTVIQGNLLATRANLSHLLAAAGALAMDVARVERKEPSS